MVERDNIIYYIEYAVTYVRLIFDIHLRRMLQPHDNTNELPVEISSELTHLRYWK
jgi:hypothetical protein